LQEDVDRRSARGPDDECALGSTVRWYTDF